MIISVESDSGADYRVPSISICKLLELAMCAVLKKLAFITISANMDFA
jgi:hypothetical protein